MPPVRVDVIVLVVLVALVLWLAPGHGVWGWVAAVGGASRSAPGEALHWPA
jgi:hypothetical protein